MVYMCMYSRPIAVFLAVYLNSSIADCRVLWLLSYKSVVSVISIAHDHTHTFIHKLDTVWRDFFCGTNFHIFHTHNENLKLIKTTNF